MEKQRRAFTAPQITEQGDAVTKTNGVGGKAWELIATRAYVVSEDPPAPEWPVWD